MGTPATGELRDLASGFEARIRIDANMRRGFALTFAGSNDRTIARERCTAMALLACRLRAAGRVDKVEDIMRVAAKARAGRPWTAVVEAVNAICSGKITAAGETPLIFAELGKQWHEGELHRKYRDHVRKKKPKSIVKDELIARLYVDPHLGPMAVADVTLLDCEQVMANIPEEKSSSLRRAIAVYMSTLLRYAVYPLRLRETTPIPKGWLPRDGATRALECVYPAEDRALLANRDRLLVRRLFFGVLSREGMRTDELGRLDWTCLDLVHGRIALDENKTDDPRDWDLDPGTWRALKAWRERFCPDAAPKDRVFLEEGVPLNLGRLPYHLRRDLKAAGVTREKLFEKSDVRSPIRAHDLRATFVTVSLANGKSETWVSDRTGHKSASMVRRYRRKARTWNMGPLAPLDEAIPELSAPPERPEDPSTRDDSGGPDRALSPENTGDAYLQSAPVDSASRCQQGAAATRRAHDASANASDSRSTRRAARATVAAHGALHGALDLDRACSLASAIEALTSGSTRALASELRGLLDAARPRAVVVDLATRRAKG